MSYAAEQRAINNNLNSINNFDLIEFGLVGETSTVRNDSAFCTLIPGAARQASTGSPQSNLHDYVSLLTITIFYTGAEGVREAKQKADQIVNHYTNLKFDEDGNVPSSSSAMVIDFARADLSPYISEERAEGSLYRVVINAPFVRTERK